MDGDKEKERIVANAKGDYKRWRDATKQVTCFCGAYAFPHRLGSGRCTAVEGEPLCECCKKPAKSKRVDMGIGRYEYAGQSAYDRQLVTVSSCCEAGFIANTRKGEAIPIEIDSPNDF